MFLFSDRPDLPYTEAVLMEIQRYANIVPTGVAHMSPSRDITVNGLTIPANTHVMPLFVELLKVSRHWTLDSRNVVFSYTGRLLGRWHHLSTRALFGHRGTMC